MAKNKARIKIKDLPRDMKISQKELKSITGGGSAFQAASFQAASYQGVSFNATSFQGTNYQGTTLQTTNYPMVYLSMEKDDD